MSAPPFNVGAFVLGPPTSPRGLVRHADLLTAYADLAIEDEREAYLSHFVFAAEMEEHFRRNRGSVAGYAGPTWCRFLILDIDRVELADALADARRLVADLQERYPEVGDVPVYFSGGKGFHVAVELAHAPPPAVGFHRTARTFAEMTAERAGVKIDPAIYDANHIVRLPNTRHPKSGLFKRRVLTEDFFRLSLSGILELAKTASGDGIPAVRTAGRRSEQRAARAPRYFLDLLRFGVPEGERHATLFRAAAWLTEQGAPPSLCLALLTEAGRDSGLTPADVERQIRCGIEHAARWRAAVAAADPRPDPDAASERLAIQHEADPLPPGAMDFPAGTFGETKAKGATA